MLTDYYQSKMRKNKNVSSVCQTTTLLTLSNITFDQSQEPFTRSRHHNHLIDKIRELQQILQKTNNEKFLLLERQEQLLDDLAYKKNILERINLPVYQASNIPDERQDDPSESVIEEEMMNTCKINQITQCMKNRQGKTHHKFYSAIQSPTVSYSPHHFHDQITLNSYCKSKFVKTATSSQKTGFIRRQKEKFNNENRSYQQIQTNSINFKSIDQIWNEGGANSKSYNSKQKPIKTFLYKVD